MTQISITFPKSIIPITNTSHFLITSLIALHVFWKPLYFWKKEGINDENKNIHHLLS